MAKRLGSVTKRGTNFRVKYGTHDSKNFYFEDYGGVAGAKKAATDWYKSQQPKWQKIAPQPGSATTDKAAYMREYYKKQNRPITTIIGKKRKKNKEILD